MPWTLNKNGVRPSGQLTASEQANLNEFMNNISRFGKHPSEAASSWDSKYTKLRGTADQYEIRLSQGCRATFRVQDATQTVLMLQVGGHT